MPAAPWQDLEWLRAHTADLAMDGTWRSVETQYIAASMKLVDSLEEQLLLEELLEASRPATPAAPARQHCLLLSPFRYFPQNSSRFRPAHHSGLWYGASTQAGACAEVAYWRMRFLLDSAGLTAGELLTEHTLFQASVRGRAINLMVPPWVEFAALWKHLLITAPPANWRQRLSSQNVWTGFGTNQCTRLFAPWLQRLRPKRSMLMRYNRINPGKNGSAKRRRMSR